MGYALRVLRWSGIIGALVVTGGILYFGSLEAYLYLTRSDAKAEAEAQKIFSDICDEQELDSDSFHGPDRPNIEQDRKNDQYSFSWSRSPAETIYINVSYLPHDFAYSISEAITERTRDARSKSLTR